MSLETIGSPAAANDGNDYYTLEAIFDFNETSTAASGVVALIDVPADSFVLKVMAEVITAEDAGTFDVGDGADADGYLDGIDSTATGVSFGNATGYLNGKYYASADTIDITVLTATHDDAKILVKAYILRK